MTDPASTVPIVPDQAAIDADTEYTDSTITDVVASEKGDGWTIGSDEGSFWVEAEHGVEPHVGDPVRFYGRGFGFPVRGLRIGDRLAYYRTVAEESERDRRQIEEWDQEARERFEPNRVNHDRRIQALPVAFRQRFVTFQRTNPDFRWKYEAYELLCCEQAVLIADTLKKAETVQEFSKADWDDQKRMVPGLDDGHSGNSFAFACRLAWEFLTDPALVMREHGAMTVIVGCETFGCPHDAQPVESEAQQ